MIWRPSRGYASWRKQSSPGNGPIESDWHDRRVVAPAPVTKPATGCAFYGTRPCPIDSQRVFAVYDAPRTTNETGESRPARKLSFKRAPDGSRRRRRKIADTCRRIDSVCEPSRRRGFAQNPRFTRGIDGREDRNSRESKQKARVACSDVRSQTSNSHRHLRFFLLSLLSSPDGDDVTGASRGTRSYCAASRLLFPFPLGNRPARRQPFWH